MQSVCRTTSSNGVQKNTSAALTAKYEPELLDGVVTISGDGVKLVPYFAWDNREAGAMAVWMRETE